MIAILDKKKLEIAGEGLGRFWGRERKGRISNAKYIFTHRCISRYARRRNGMHKRLMI